MSHSYRIEGLHQIETLDEFLTLNRHQKKLQKELEQLVGETHSPHSSLEKILLLKTADIATLIKIAEHSPIVFNFIKQKSFDPFWEEAWRLMGINPSRSHLNSDAPMHNMLPQPNIDCRSLYFGYFFFRKAYQIREITGRKYSSAELGFLEKAESYYSFHALNALNKHDLLQLQNCIETKEHCSRLDLILDRANLAAQYHDAPGYLLLAETCYKIANYNQHVLNNNTAITAALKLSLKYYIIAEHKFQESESTINNAYFGEGIAASNHYKIDNITALKKWMIANTGGYLNDEAIKWAEHAAKLDSESRSASVHCPINSPSLS